MASITIGTTVFVRYQGHPLWHERLVLARVGCSSSMYIILTPDDDMYAEEFHNSNTDIEGFKKGVAGGGLPRGIAAGEAYRFRSVPTGRELRDLMAEAEAEAENEVIRGGSTIPAEDIAASGVWISLEDFGHIKRGDKVDVPADATILGNKAIHVFQVNGNDVHICCSRVAPHMVEDFKKSLNIEADDDARALPIKLIGTQRQRDFREGVEMMSQVAFTDWPVPGPRSVRWCLSFLVKRGGPMAHHEWWKATAKLQMSDVGVCEHENCMRAVEDGICYDQSDASNLASYEHILRKAQLWEYYYKEKVRVEIAASKDRSIVDLEEQQVFMGSLGTEGSLMICPQLTDWVARELERISSVDKQARKAREERALRRK